MKKLVAYYSAQNHTKEIGEKIAKYLNADTFEIVPKDVYTDEDLDWTNDNSRVCKEYHNEISRDIPLVNAKIDLSNYDTIIIAYPIWWGIAAWPVNSFVKANNFEGKNVIPVATSYSSSLGESANLLEKEANGGNFVDAKRFYQDASDEDIKAWVDSLNI